jgi:cold shock CspA family protein
MEAGMAEGSVKWLNRGKGYGFISRGGGLQDVVFDRDAVVAWQSLDEGVDVVFEVVETEHGPRAVDVRRDDDDDDGNDSESQ